jgi:thiol-disulfide isomerase/thioredoxin
MPSHAPPPSDDQPRSAETVAIVELDTPPSSPAVSDVPPVLRDPSSRSTNVRPVQPPRGLRSRAVRATFLAALVASLAWGVLEIRHWLSIKPKPPRAGTTAATPSATGTGLASPSAVEATDTADFDDDDDATYPGLRAFSFLRTHVRKDQKDGEGPIVELAGVIAPQAVTVVNLWATWCGPCRSEFAGFKKMFELNQRDQAWGAETRFVPILVDDAENVRTAYATYSGDMPNIHAPLIDLKLDGGGVRGAFSDLKLPADTGLPVTLLFDCHRRLRWSKASALDEAAFAALADEIDKLRAELRQDKCKPRRSAPTEAPNPEAASTDPPRKSSCNQNDKCDPGEDCGRCPRECRCKDGEKCNIRPDGHGVCKENI